MTRFRLENKYEEQQRWRLGKLYFGALMHSQESSKTIECQINGPLSPILNIYTNTKCKANVYNNHSSVVIRSFCCSFTQDIFKQTCIRPFSHSNWKCENVSSSKTIKRKEKLLLLKKVQPFDFRWIQILNGIDCEFCVCLWKWKIKIQMECYNWKISISINVKYQKVMKNFVLHLGDWSQPFEWKRPSILTKNKHCRIKFAFDP